MLADFGDLLWAKDFGYKTEVMTLIYHAPGGVLVGLAAVCLRMMIEDVLKRISLALARSRLWTVLCVVFWLVVMKTTPISDAFAKKIHWDQVIHIPAAESPRPEAPRAR